jgi:membrane associated rhomboid family serine protease
LLSADIVSGVETCYRHPGRETGVSCSSCGRPICPDCMTATPVGMRCPECARQRTKVKTARTMYADPTLTYILMGINVIVFLGEMLGGAGATSGFGGELAARGALYGPAVADGEVWRLLTAGFLHGGILHILFNMYALYILGTMLEPAVGRLRFGLIYFVSLLCGSLGVLLIDPNQVTLGASGAVFGLMGAAVVVMRNRGVDLMQSGLPIWIGINLLITFTIPHISIGGHIGGLIGGALVAVLLFELPERLRLPPVAATVLAGALGAAVIAASVAVVA